MTPVLRTLCWIRRDLRVRDHRSLELATRHSERTAVAFVFDRQILDKLPDRDDRRVTFIGHSLREVDRELAGHGSRLAVLHGDPVDEIPRLALALGVQRVVTARDAEPYARARDAEVQARLADLGIEFVTVKDTVGMEGGEVFSQTGTPLRVFTPYKRAWMAAMVPEVDLAEAEPDMGKLWPAEELSAYHWSGDLSTVGFRESDLWLPAGETAARERLGTFLRVVDQYGELRDFPDAGATSGLSVHLRFGTISIRECLRAGFAAASPGADKWVSELIWRDFYHDVIYHHPHVVTETFQEAYRDLSFPGTEEHFERWCAGETGYPIVDAAMRHFNRTGWMHNRLRMVVASFLTKDLLVDYRRGEAYFARYLLDFDLASNNGGWQWAASTGVDAQPYFRIFNPVLQSRKFDPSGGFLRANLPELAELSDDQIHWPHEVSAFDLASAGVVIGENYPAPIVDHAEQKAMAIRLLDRKSD